MISFIAPATYQDVRVGAAVVTLSASLMDQAAARARDAIIYATLAMTLLASLLAYWLSRRLSLPIHHLMEATRAIDRGDLAIRIDDQRNDEIGFLFEGFNNMATGLLKRSQVKAATRQFYMQEVRPVSTRHCQPVSLPLNGRQGAQARLGLHVYLRRVDARDAYSDPAPSTAA